MGDAGSAAKPVIPFPSGQKERGRVRRAGKTVLCIDDHENALAGWSLYLQGAGYRVLGATSPAEGLELFGTKPVDAVLLDYSMPDMDGSEVASAMKRVKPEVPVILFSGRVLPAEIVERVDGVIFKGEPPQNVLNALDDLLDVAA